MGFRARRPTLPPCAGRTAGLQLDRNGHRRRGHRPWDSGGFYEFFAAELERGTLVEILSDWLEPFPGPSLYYHSRRLMPARLRAFIDFIRADGKEA